MKSFFGNDCNALKEDHDKENSEYIYCKGTLPSLLSY
jgi:hypothetical protein